MSEASGRADVEFSERSAVPAALAASAGAPVGAAMDDCHVRRYQPPSGWGARFSVSIRRWAYGLTPDAVICEPSLDDGGAAGAGAVADEALQRVLERLR